MKMVLFFIIIALCHFAVAQNKLFPKSRNKLKIKDCLIEGEISKFSIPTEIKFTIAQKNARKSRHENFSIVSFGCENHFCYNLVKLSHDTLFYSSNEIDDTNKLFQPIFVLNRIAKGDTLMVEKFGVIENQNIVLSEQFFSTQLNDTIYTYYLFKKEEPEYNANGIRIVHSDETDRTIVFEIGIGEKHGFVWVKYKYYGVFYDLRFY